MYNEIITVLECSDLNFYIIYCYLINTISINNLMLIKI